VPRIATLIAALVLALPGTALAQGAGDDQYQDPFEDQAAAQQQGGDGGGQAQGAQDGGLTDEPPVSGSGGGDSGSSGSGSGSAGQSGSATTPQTPEQPAPATGAEAQSGAQLPNTGSDPRLLLLFGLAFLLIGVGLRLRTIDPDAY
jgi:LPXTG-motif cell wall-anchored protein